MDSASPQSGVSRPRAGTFRDSALGARYNTFDSERYVLSLDDRKWRDVAAAVPYDAVLILVNERKYGGGGIFNLYSTAAADSAPGSIHGRSTSPTGRTEGASSSSRRRSIAYSLRAGASGSSLIA